MELYTVAICLKIAPGCGCHTSVTARRRRTGGPHFQEHGTGGSFYPADKVSIGMCKPVSKTV